MNKYSNSNVSQYIFVVILRECIESIQSSAKVHINYFMVKKLFILYMYINTQIAQIFEKSRSILKILGVGRVTWNKLKTEDS
jgi:hypothetical protein